MTTVQRLAVYRETERRNAERVQGGFIKHQVVARDIRVVVRADGKGGFWIEAQQYNPTCPYQWEVEPDGWRTTSSEHSASFEGAMRVFGRKVADERRYVEMR